jgi:ubiquinone/menaquinone biosynthesis C-methylase UbiE
VADYVYKDNEAGMPKLSAMLTSRMGDGQGNHEAAYLDTINLLVAALGSGSMIDIGCGMGRITLAAAGKIHELVALEPDAARCNWTREAVADKPGVSVLNTTSADFIASYPDKQFDLAVLGMVIQHLSTHKSRMLMQDVARLTRPGGLAVISTTHALERAKCFTFQHAARSRVSEEEFNRYADNPELQDKGVPVHRYSRSELEAIVPDAFDIVQWTQYSYYRPEHLDRFAKVHQVKPEELADIGNSQFLVLKKSVQEERR